MNFVIVSVYGQEIQLHVAEGISDSTRRQWGTLKYTQVCLLASLLPFWGLYKYRIRALTCFVMLDTCRQKDAKFDLLQ